MKYCMGCMEQYEDELNKCPYCGYEEGTQAEQALHMEPGSILHERFIVGKALGYGGFGVTYIGWDALLEQKVAIKEYLPSEFSTRMPGVTKVTVYNGDKSQQFNDGLSRFVDEAKRLAKLNNISGIVRIYDSFEENNTAYIIMEYLEGETLSARLKREGKIDPDEAVAMLLPVIRSMEEVHKYGIIHRDIAPDNIFITKDGTVKLIDFGASRYATTSHSRSLTVIIKPGFSPEEQYRSRGDQGTYTDVYALAATLYRMITGKTPPDALERRAYFENKKKDILKSVTNYCPDIDRNTENAILNALNVRIEDRTPTMEKFAEELTSKEPVVRKNGKIKKIDLLRWPLWAKIVIPLAAVFVVVVGALFATGVIHFSSNLQDEIVVPEGMTRVPSVVNSTLDHAEDRIEEAVLLYAISGKEYSEYIPANYVLLQDINAGQLVIQNSMLNIVISGGIQSVEVPDLLNTDAKEAKAILEDLGFEVETIEEYDSVVSKGCVISQSIDAAAEAAYGDKITLVVSKGVDPAEELEKKAVTIPAFEGKTYEEAVKLAQDTGVSLSVEKEYSNTVKQDTVISQNPKSGAKGYTGDTINLVVSLGKEIVKVPDVKYLSEAEARKAIEGAKLKATVTYQESDTVAEGLVLSQSPDAQTEAGPGSTVKITVSKGTAGFAMPNVVGKTEATANSTLTEKGLSVSVTYEYSSSVATGNVIKQSISSGTQVKKGAAVTITVSSGQETVKVPNVVGQSKTNAQNTLKNSGFAVSVSETYSDTVASGNVINQTPAAGSSQIKGATISIIVSKGKNEIKKISVNSLPTKTSYTVGDNLSTAGLSLTATYSDGSTQVVGSGFTCSPTTLNNTGTQTITVTYSGKTTTFNVTVNAATVTGISVKSMPSKTSYTQGDTLSTSGLSLNVNSSNGTTQTVSSGFTCSPTTLNNTGTQTITVTYSGKTTSFNVTVNAATVTGISVKSMPSKTSYTQGDTLSTSGLSLNVSYSNGTTQTVNSGFTCSPTTLNSTGTQTITVTYSGKTTTFNVTVNAKTIEVTGIEIWADGYVLDVGTSMTALPGDTKQLSAVIKPSNATNKSVTWKSSNTSVATVDQNGRLKAIAEGEATITVTAENGVYNSRKVTVEAQLDFGLSLFIDSITDSFDGKTYSYNNILQGLAQYHPGSNLEIEIEVDLNAVGMSRNNTGIDSVTISVPNNCKIKSVSGINCSYSQSGSTCYLSGITNQFSSNDNQHVAMLSFSCSTPSTAQDYSLSFSGSITSMHGTSGNTMTSDANNNNNSSSKSVTLKAYEAPATHTVDDYSLQIKVVERNGNVVKLTTTSNYPDFNPAEVMWTVDNNQYVETFSATSGSNGVCTFSATKGCTITTYYYIAYTDSNGNNKVTALSANYVYAPN